MNSLPTSIDASSGFHDIKSLPIFSPLNLTWLYALLALLLCAYLIRKFLERKEKPLSPPPPMPAWDTALEALKALRAEFEKQTLGLRTYCERLSMIIRLFLEATLSFPAPDLTRLEIKSILPRHLIKQLPATSAENRSKLAEDILQLLKNTEFLAFADDQSIQRTGGGDPAALVDKAEELVTLIAEWIKDSEAVSASLDTQPTINQTEVADAV